MELMHNLKELLPKLLRLYVKLFLLANADDNDINYSFKELSKKTNYDDERELFFWLSFLSDLNIIEYTMPPNYTAKTKIKLLIL